LGIQDRDYYWEDRLKKARPKDLRRSPGVDSGYIVDIPPGPPNPPGVNASSGGKLAAVLAVVVCYLGWHVYDLRQQVAALERINRIQADQLRAERERDAAVQRARSLTRPPAQQQPQKPPIQFFNK